MKPIRLLISAALAALFLAGAYTHFQPARWMRSRIPGEAGITRGQLARATANRLRLEGKSGPATPADEKAALASLAARARLQTAADAFLPAIEVAPREIDARLASLAAAFKGQADFEKALQSQGIPDVAAMRDRLAADLRREKFAAMRLAPEIRVTDGEAREWFARHGKSLGQPERVRVRQIFVATLERPAEKAKATLDSALAALAAGRKDFATLAREISDDPASREHGGELGWLVRERLPPDFAGQVFALRKSKPALIRTSLGWHLVEVTARKPAAPRGFEEAKPEIVAALEALKRRDAAKKGGF